MDVYEALYTTRAMRRLKPDPIPLDVQAKILDAAIRAPTGGNSQNWRFLFVDDKELIGQLGEIYQRCIGQLWKTFYKERLGKANANPELPESIADLKMQRSAQHLADHFADVPLLLFGFAEGDGVGRIDLPGDLERPARRPRRGHRHVADPGDGLRAARRARSCSACRRAPTGTCRAA